jgi:hypothetical protein
MSRLDKTRYRGQVAARAARHGISVVFHNEGVQPHTTGRSIHVGQPDVGWTEEQWDEWYYHINHEIGHERGVWCEWKKVMEEKKMVMGSIIAMLNNLNSDQAQEHDGYGEYFGVDIVLGEGRRNFVLKNTSTRDVENEQDACFQAAWWYDALKREDWNPAMSGVFSSLPTLPAESQEKLDKLLVWGKSAADCANEWEVYDYTLEMLEVMGLDSEELEKEMQEAYDKMKGEGGEGGSEDKDAGDEGDGEEGSIRFSKYEDLFEHKHDRNEGSSYKDGHIDYSTWERTRGKYLLRPLEIIDLRKGDNPYGRRAREFEDARGSHAFATKVRKILQVRSATRYEGGKRHGKLNARSVWKCKTHNPHVFKKKVENLDLKDTVVTLLVDFSGSMGGGKIGHACTSCLLLNNAITKLGVKTQILGFTDSDAPIEYRIKEWDENTPSHKIVERFGEAGKYMSENSDGESLLYAYNRLLGRREKKKILIVLSDGSPASSAYGMDDDGYLHHVTTMIQKSGRVKLYGIGIKDGSVNRYYKHRTVIKRSDELEDRLLEVVEQQILE